jgi:hypothetical protein
MMIEKRISTENWREYEYEDGYVLRINSPHTLYISESGTHRVFDNHEIVHYVPPGWRTIRWSPVDVSQPVAF